MTKFVAVVSGKGGAGKTTTTLNIGQALTNYGLKVLLVDANLVTPNLAIQLGFMNPEGTINKFLRKEKSLKEITYLHESGLSLIPASPSFKEFQKTNSQDLTKIFKQLNKTADFVLVDAPSGLGYEVSQVIKNSNEVLIVANPTLSSVVDALKSIKLAKEHNILIAGVILNMTNKGKYELSESEVGDILGHPIIANIKNDKKIRKSLHLQVPLTYKYPKSKSSKEYHRVAELLSHNQIR